MGHQMAKGLVRCLVLASRTASICLLAVIPLMLACEVAPTKTSRPPPTPIKLSVDALTRAYEGNSVLAANRFDGNAVLAYGVQHTVEERTLGGYVLVIETGVFDSILKVRCHTDELPYSMKGDGVEAWGIVSTDSMGRIVLEDCWRFWQDNPLSEVLRVSGYHPTRAEIQDACRILEKAGFDKVAGNTEITRAEGKRIVDVVRSLSMQHDDMMLTIPEAIIEIEGGGSEAWCGQWQ